VRPALYIAAIAAALAGCRDDGGTVPEPDADMQYPYEPPRTDFGPTIGTDATLEIATWNLENFPASSATPKLVADLIASMNLDVVVVEEIANDAAWDELISRLRDHDGVLSTHQYSTTSYQKIGVIYRTSLVSVAPFELLFASDGWAWPRPALSVPVTIGGSTIELIGVHLKAGVGYDDADRRRQAVAQLDTFLRGQIDAGGESEIVLLGDYNEIVTDPDGRDVLAPLLTAPERYTMRTEPSAVAGDITYLGFGGKFIDHVTTTAALDATWTTARLEVPRLDEVFTQYRSMVSDHLPAVLIAPRP
jgi:endonuclease/exonuclease/phosphatase family metal-dependent hydrolase